ncbi:MAG: hypothetical protein U0175_00010 [Caldilineaceae bacterium]
MKAIHYDTEGDILTVTFSDGQRLNQQGIELSENIVLYYDPTAEEPIALILLSYKALLRESEQHPITLDGLERAPQSVQKIIQSLLKRVPLSIFLEISERQNGAAPTSRLHEIFAPTALELVTA